MQLTLIASDHYGFLQKRAALTFKINQSLKLILCERCISNVDTWMSDFCQTLLEQQVFFFKVAFKNHLKIGAFCSNVHDTWHNPGFLWNNEHINRLVYSCYWLKMVTDLNEHGRILFTLFGSTTQILLSGSKRYVCIIIVSSSSSCFSIVHIKSLPLDSPPKLYTYTVSVYHVCIARNVKNANCLLKQNIYSVWSNAVHFHNLEHIAVSGV